MFRMTLLIALTVLLLSCGLSTQGTLTELERLSTDAVVQDKSVESPVAPMMTQDKPQESPTPVPVAKNTVESPVAPVMTQDKPQESPTPVPVAKNTVESPVAPMMTQDKPQESPTPVPVAKNTVETPVAPMMTQDKPQESPTPTQQIELEVAPMGPPWAGDSSIGLKAVYNDTVVKATMTSFSSEVVLVTDIYHSGSDNRYSPILKFNLSVSEYLTGTGPTSTVAILLNANTYETRDEANYDLARILAERDGQWDDREAILFMVSDPEISYGTVLDGLFDQDDHFFLSKSETFSYDDMYSLHSESHRKWLPAVATTTAGDAQEFLLDVPPTDATINLGDLRKRVSEVAAELVAGDGSEAYITCLRYKYEDLTNQQNWPGERGGPYSSWKVDHNVVSGMPAGTVLDKHQGYGRYPDSGVRVKRWVENRDADLFTYEHGVVTNLDEDDDGDFDRITYDIMVQTVRPLIAGEYSFDFKESTPYYQQCNYVISDPWTVTVASPPSIPHEFFFDPVAVGTTVAANSTDGVLKPASFTGANGATTTISSLAWEPASTSSAATDGQVKLLLTSDSGPYDVMGEHILDFIALDGSVSLSLDMFDATVESGTATSSHSVTWPLSSQPWDADDKLMVQIREAPPSCRSSSVIPDARTSPGLVGDCEVLMAARDTLDGTATLNWGFDTALVDWEGVTIGRTPRRVTRLRVQRGGLTGGIPPELSGLSALMVLDLSGNRLEGEIPPELGELSALTDLDLSSNRLTGEIPSELGQLSELEWLFLEGNRLSGEILPEIGGLTALRRLYLQYNSLTGGIPPEIGGLTDLFHLWLYGNRLGGTIPWELVNLSGLDLLQLGDNGFTGCVPVGLREVRLNDIASLRLADCTHGLVGAPQGLEASVAADAFSLTWSAVAGAGQYEAQYAEGSGGDWDVVGTTTATSTVFAPDGGAACGTTYRFRVRAYGDTRTHAAGWGPESSEVPVTTGACNRAPEFASTTYSFRVAEDAATSTAVGAVTATDADGDMLEYRITSGNTSSSFSVGTSTGEIAVAGMLDYETTPSHVLTVEASDGRGGSATATVHIAITDVAEDTPPAPTGLSASLTAGEFSLSWDPLTGASHYEAQYRDDPTGNWDVIGTTTVTSTVFSPVGGPACGTTYRFRVRAYGDAQTRAAGWGPESSESTVTTQPCNRPPEFATSTYSFTVAEDAATSTVVGTVLATDPDDAVVYHSITTGNEALRFSITSTGGEIALAQQLDYESVSSYTLTVEASDRNEPEAGVATTSVRVQVANVGEASPPAPTGLMASETGEEFTLRWDAISGVAHYEGQYRSGSGQDWTTAGTTTATTLSFRPADGPRCGGATYEFRVRAHGDGEAFVAAWGTESGTVSVTTGACNRPPAFADSSHSFTVNENAATSTSVGTLSATDPDNDSLTYRITEGNDDGLFAIGAGTGAITVAGALDHATGAFHVLNVEADDDRGGVATSTVDVTVILPGCRTGQAVEYPLSHPQLVRDCSILLAARDTLAGSGTLNWSTSLRMSDWDGVWLGSVPNMYVKDLRLENAGLAGTIPAVLEGLKDMRILELTDNSLSGQIPPGLGRLSELTHLYLSDNGLSGPIPPQLANLAELEVLYLSDNSLTGTIPSGLRDVENSDLERMEMDYCP